MRVAVVGVQERSIYDSVVLGVIGATLFFNFALCFVNTNVMGVGQMHVILVEAAIVGVTWGLLLFTQRPLDLRWFCYLLAMICCVMLVMGLRGEIQTKAIRDLLLIPTFVMLGIQYGRQDLTKPLMVLFPVILAIGIFEAAFIDLYTRFFDVLRYYVARGFFADFAQGPGSGEASLFVSAMRSSGRMFGDILGLGPHRVSSIFLEPISSAAFSAIVFFYTLAAFDTIDRRRAKLVLAMAVLLLIMSDGRMATGLCMFAVIAWAGLHRLPKLSLFFHLPVAIFAAFIIQATFTHGRFDDDIVARVSLTAKMLGSMDLAVIAGIEKFSVGFTGDSGYAYLMENVGLLGVLVLWFGLCTLLQYNDIAQRRFAHMVCIYLSVSWLVGAGTFTIKTAALLWFMCGTLQRSLPFERR